jgi:uncharacterized protein
MPKAEARKGHFMETASGGIFYPLDPRPGEVSVLDIAHHLSRINRYNGAIIPEHYSVAEHSVLMSIALFRDYNDPLLSYQALMHDATEAYVGDMVRPLKRDMPAFEEAEARVWRAIVDSSEVLKLKGDIQGDLYALDPRVVEADSRILLDERSQVMKPTGNDWGLDGLEPLDIKISGVSPSIAKDSFILRETLLRMMILVRR